MPVLTRRLVDGAAPRDTEYQIYDGEIPGLPLRVNPERAEGALEAPASQWRGDF